MNSIIHIIILIAVIALHLSYEHLVVRKKIEEDNEDMNYYDGIGFIMMFGIWYYFEYLISDKWELISSHWVIFFCFFAPYAILSGVFRRYWKQNLKHFRQKKNKAKITY